jgi:hypothetical protein
MPAEYLRQTALMRATLDRLERELVDACGLPIEAQRIVAAEVARVRAEIDQADLRVGIRLPLRVVRP